MYPLYYPMLGVHNSTIGFALDLAQPPESGTIIRMYK